MGCLKATATLLNTDGIDVSAQNMNTGVMVTSQCLNELHVSAECKNTHIVVEAVPLNTPISAQVQVMNTGIRVRAALICSVSLGEYETVYVDEGPLLVEEGYLRVRKERRAE